MDQLISHFDTALRTCSGSIGQTNRQSPAATNVEPVSLTPEETALSARLMRVNHCGEVCAQALYHGQALTSKSDRVATKMKIAAAEETDHLSWCESRIKQLDSHVSVLNPFWYSASFIMGAAAGLLGDKVNLGFVAATEEGVCKHLDEHLIELPKSDSTSHVILTEMRADEAKHMKTALESGGSQFPRPAKAVMAMVSKLMTKTTYWI